MSGFRLIIVLVGLLCTSGTVLAQGWESHTTSNNSMVNKRHETGSVAHGDKLYVIGGRNKRPTQVFDASENKWTTLAPAPLEIHHFQPVVVNGYIYVIGAFTCCYPIEDNVPEIHRYNLATNEWDIAGTVPANRVRGCLLYTSPSPRD